MKNTSRSLAWLQYAIPLALLNGCLYFILAVSGGANLQRLLNFESQNCIYVICLLAAFVYGTFAFKAFETMTLKPPNYYTWLFAIISPLAATSFFTAGIEGAQLLHFSNLALIISCAIILFIMRAINFIDGAVKLPARLRETHATWVYAFTNRDFKSLLCVIITIYASVGYSLSTTDPIFAALTKISSWLHLTPSPTLFIIHYVLTIIAVVAGFPMFLYWIQRGITQIANNGKEGNDGINRDPTDIFTYVAMLAATPVMLGALGAATTLHPVIFGQLGWPADIVRVTTSAICSPCMGVPGLATLFRSLYALLPERATAP